MYNLLVLLHFAYPPPTAPPIAPPTHTYRLVQLPHFPFPVERDQLVHGLCEGVKLDVHFPGFPSLKHIHHTGQLEKRGVRVFQSASRGENLCLSIAPKEIPKVSWSHIHAYLAIWLVDNLYKIVVNVLI